MANRKVTLLRYCKTENGWRRFPVVMGKTGKVRPNTVLVNGRERIYPEGYYCIRTYQGRKPGYTNVGTDPTEALQRQQKEERLRTARDSAQEAGTSIVERVPSDTLRQWAKKFLFEKSLESHRSRDTMDGYNIVIKEFISGCGAEYPNQIEAVDVLQYCAGIETRGLSARTRANRFSALCTFLKFSEVELAKILSKERRKMLGRFPKTQPTTYTQKELDRLLAACNDYYRIVFMFLVSTGFRMQEAMHLTWPDVAFEDSVVSVKRKPGVFEVKDGEERTVPLPRNVAEELRNWKEQRKITHLVFGTRSDRPNNHWLEYLKAYATKAGLNCGSCSGCQRTIPECGCFRIHKFRSTYGTRLLRNGVDVSTVQALLGHSDLKSTLGYLQPAQGATMQAAVNAALQAAASGA